MNKHKYLICLLVLNFISSCKAEPINIEPVKIISRTNDKYVVEEIELPTVLQFQNEPMIYIDVFHNEGYQLTINVLDKTKSNLYPVDASYKYNLLTNELTNNERLIVDDYRVYYQINDEFGSTYQLVGYYINGLQYLELYYNGKPIVNTNVLSINTFNLRGFQLLNGHIYIFIEEILEDNNFTKWTMYELNQGTAKALYSLDTVRAWGGNIVDKESLTVTLPPIQNNSKNRMAYVIREDEEYYVELFDGVNLVEFEVPSTPVTIIPLENYVLYYFSEWQDENGDEVIYPLYCYNVQTGDIKQIDTLDYQIGMTYQAQGNEFYREDRNEMLNVCNVSEDELKCRQIEDIANIMTIDAIYQLDDNTDFVHITDHDFNNHIYLIHWN